MYIFGLLPKNKQTKKNQFREGETRSKINNIIPGARAIKVLYSAYLFLA